ncbi:MAG: 2-dehydropantoate 2-reductase [Alphaproteobacteria bacterium]|nr:2-dehydropantoate 2-reductase [Alphaproteobacteria bacterium]
MRIAIFGVGAMGSVYAGMLAEAGNEVVAVDPWAEHTAVINADGLRVEGASGDRRVRGIRASVDARIAMNCDLYVIATKAAAVGKAACVVAPLLHGGATVLAIQNGLGVGESAAAHLPDGSLLLGVAGGFGAEMRAPGHVFHAAMKSIWLGELGGGLTPRLEAIAAAWSLAGFHAEAYSDIKQLIWEKYICNVAFSAPCTVFDCTLGEVLADIGKWRVAAGCAREAFAIAHALGIELSFTDPLAHVTEFAEQMPNARPSMLLDHHAGRRSEIDAINGMAVKLGRKTGVATPFNEEVSTIVRERESRFADSLSGVPTPGIS